MLLHSLSKYVLSCLTLACAAATSSVQAETSPHFITAKGDKLYVGDEEFRFMSFNIPNLHLVEDNFSFESPNPWRWPDEFEIRDALESIRQMGGNATRIYVLSVQREGSDMGDHVYVRGPGEFNEDAFRVLDKVLQIANEKGVRVVIPLVDNWHWWGGRAEYAKFRGKSADDFWTDEQLINDFKQTIHFTLNRTNTYTGVAYKDDPAILGWETGNELDSTPEWTAKISAYIKSLDKNHLLIDGYALHGVRKESLDDPNIDVITTHHYPNTDTDYVAAITKAHRMTAGRKPYFVGEFGFVSPEILEQVMDTIINKGISGGMLWSLRFRNREGGFYWHSEPSGENLYKAYHWPGFESGAPYFERQILKLTQRKSYQIRGLKVPAPALPTPPKLLPIADASRISWQGSTGATRYDVERASNGEGPWTLVGEDISDAAVQYRPLFSDESVQVDEEYFYRVLAKNSAGSSTPSNVIGPVHVDRLTMADECQDFSKLHGAPHNVKILSLQARKTQEDIHRFELASKSQVTYRTKGPIQEWQILLFNEDGATKPVVSCSSDGKSYQACKVVSKPVPVGSGDYGYLRPMLLSGKPAQRASRYLKIESPSHGSKIELSRIEITSGNPSDADQEGKQSVHHGAQLNPSILMFHKPDHVHGVDYVRHAASLGCQKVNAVVTLSCQINEHNEVVGFGVRDSGRYKSLNEARLGEFKSAVNEVFAEVAAQGMQLSILAHLNAGGPRYEWRNHFLFDPLAYYEGFSYQDTMIATIQEALAATPELKTPVDISLAGEMGRSVFAYPASYSRLLDQLKTDERLPELCVGVSFNFNNAAGEFEPSPSQRAEAQSLISRCDFVGMSNYRWFELPIEPNDFKLAKQAFLQDMKRSGATVPPEMPLHFSEVGIGGGKEEGLAKTPREASLTPWEGSDNPRKNPWKTAEMKEFRVDFHRALLDYLAEPSATNPVTDAYLWSEGSWDPLDTTDKGFADPTIIRMIQEHNQKNGE